MTQQELNALVEILNRCPMTQAERIWLAGLVERLAAEAAQKVQSTEANDEDS